MMKKTISRIGTPTLYLFVLMLLTACGRLATIPMSPETTPDQWLKTHPHLNLELFSSAFVLAKPSSSAIVYSLGVLTIIIGILFLLRRENEKSRHWWGLGLLLWGIGTLFAGTSYQAFAWEIKCAGQAFCSWTSWYEVIYMIFEVASINALLVAVAHSTVRGNALKLAKVYGAANMLVYLAVSLTGAVLPSWFMVSFELMMLFCFPGLVAAFVLNLRGYRRKKDPMNRNLVITWLLLLLVMVAYYAYLLSGIAEQLWADGIWFSANDVLHIGLILWMLYIAIAVRGRVVDLKNAS
ncbi:MAG: DUF6962 family protein [Spirochaetota bacterium]